MSLQLTPTAGDTSWFVHDRFGMFIHWGLYALPARHEWVKQLRADPRRGVPEVLRALRPRPVRPEASGRRRRRTPG